MNTARFLKYVWPFYNIMHERVNHITSNTLDVLSLSDYQMSMIHPVIFMNAFVCGT